MNLKQQCSVYLMSLLNLKVGYLIISSRLSSYNHYYLLWNYVRSLMINNLFRTYPNCYKGGKRFLRWQSNWSYEGNIGKSRCNWKLKWWKWQMVPYRIWNKVRSFDSNTLLLVWFQGWNYWKEYNSKDNINDLVFIFQVPKLHINDEMLSDLLLYMYTIKTLLYQNYLSLFQCNSTSNCSWCP